MFKIRGEIFRLDILDTSGNDPYPAIKKLNIMTGWLLFLLPISHDPNFYIKLNFKGDLFVLVFNIDELDTCNQIKQLQDLILELKKTKQKNSKNKVPIMILANKKDRLLERRNLNRDYFTTEMNNVSVSAFKPSLYFEISCKQSIGIENAFEKLFTLATLPFEMVTVTYSRRFISVVAY